MENKINVAELLKDCPKGMELDCTIYDNIVFDYIQDWVHPIRVVTKDNEMHLNLTKYGCTSEHKNAKCVIFPKGKTTWEGFVPPCKFKDGDILYIDCTDECDDKQYDYIFILNRIYNGEVHSNCHYYIPDDEFQIRDLLAVCLTNDKYPIRFATEEEKQKLFDSIKANGYRWNAETKTLEELIESKEDINDEILISGIYFDKKNHADKVELHLGNYEIEICDGRTYAVFKNQKTKTFEQPKFKVGDKIRLKENHNYIYTITGIREGENKYECGVTFVLRFSEQDDWELAPNKFDITTLKPFESKVLVRDSEKGKWHPAFWGFYDIDSVRIYPYECCGNSFSFAQCIPYNDDTKHLLGKTDDCNEFYKTWE